MKRTVIFFAILFYGTLLMAQEDMKQTIRGKVVDEVTGYGLIGANVIVTGTEPLIGTTTDMNGEFVLEEVDFEAGEIYQVYQQGFYPMFLYRIQF